jgi:hypothetical protein
MSHPISVVLTTHDDWLQFIMLSNGVVYCFNTELWEQHAGFEHPAWSPAVVRHAIDRALRADANNVAPFTTLPLGLITMPAFKDALNAACLAMDDRTFSRGIL